jgi:predicted nucleotidyltransferase
MINPALLLPRDELAAFCRRWQITELALFGSALRDDFGPESDIDLLVSFAPNAGHSLLDIVQMEDELEEMLGREVDLVERAAIEKSDNWIRRRAILNSAEPLDVP